MPPIRLLELTGNNYDMGYQHGLAYAEEIRAITAERIHLCSDPAWTGRSLPLQRILSLADECLKEHEAYAPELIDQLRGISDATGISLRELIITNGFTDFADVIYNALEREPASPIFGQECTTFIADGFIGQTWDMHATATPYVIVLHGKPDHDPHFLAFTITGCVAMIGMNDAGIAVGINNLAGADGQPGVTWPFICRKILAQTTLEDALECITSAKLAGGHNYMLADANGRGYNVEAMTTACHIEPLADAPLIHANICLAATTQAVERPLTDDLTDDSGKRLNRAADYLKQRPAQLDDLMQLTRDRSDGSYSVCAMSEPPFYSETCGAVIMRPASLDFWGVWGLPTENDYEHFKL